MFKLYKSSYKKLNNMKVKITH